LAALIEHSEEELLEFEAARTELSVSVAALRERLSLLEAAPEVRRTSFTFAEISRTFS
jgi:hypothetical protein